VPPEKIKKPLSKLHRGFLILRLSIFF